MTLPKAAFQVPKAHIIIGRGSIYQRAEGPFTTPPKAKFHGPKARSCEGPAGQKPEGPFMTPPKAAIKEPKSRLIMAEGGDLRAKGAFMTPPRAQACSLTSPPKAALFGPKARKPSAGAS